MFKVPIQVTSPPPAKTATGCEPASNVTRCIVNMAHTRQSRPDFRFGFQGKDLKTSRDVPSSLESCRTSSRARWEHQTFYRRILKYTSCYLTLGRLLIFSSREHLPEVSRRGVRPLRVRPASQGMPSNFYLKAQAKIWP